MAIAVLNPGRDKRVHYGHPWVYRSDIHHVTGAFTPGDVIEVHSSHGKFIGRAMYNPASQIALRFFTVHDEPVDEAFIRMRVRRAIGYRRAFADLKSSRLIFAESDGLPGLVADAFGDVIVIQSLALGIDRWKGIIIDELASMLAPRGIWERSDVKVRELEGMAQTQGLLRGEVPDRVEIIENGVRFLVDVKQGQKTGYFLDQKENRAAIAPFVKGARVLDCFTHTGAFALHAAHYGASEVVGVDISALALEQAAENARLNGLSVGFEEANAFDLLRAQHDAKTRYDMIILDPPAFTKTRSAIEAALRGYKEINLRAMKMVRDGGYLVTCSCSHHVLPEAFAKMLVSAASDAKVQLRQIEARTQGRDHPILSASPETQYLKCHILQVYK
ncbi:MAG: class I SAM-dependent rRNA methyltransferase [Oscillospiraceae bacterium]|jgi:23S rRNA (cytosine1962-C5)-methyltransferase|nr:class I SAM-dependent rRNA methyltransferase [Oscillospiraceae bacterium]